MSVQETACRRDIRSTQYVPGISDYAPGGKAHRGAGSEGIIPNSRFTLNGDSLCQVD